MGSVMDDAVEDATASEEVHAARGRRVSTWLVLLAVLAALGVWAFVLRPQERPSLDASLPPEIPNPCSLLDRTELEEILGRVGEPQERPGMGSFPGQRACMIPRPDNPVPAAVVGLLAAADPITLRAGHPQFGGNVEVVEGIGDDAVWMGLFRVFAVAKGEWLLSVQMLEFTAPEQTRDRAEMVATMAVARL